MPITLDGTLGITTPALTVTGATVNTGGISTGGNLTFTTAGSRILGDMTTGTIPNRLAFQTSTANSTTVLTVIPSGTSTTAALNLETDSALTNASIFQLNQSASESRINSTIRGTGTYVPLTFYTSSSERMRIDTSGNVGIGTSSPVVKLDAYGAQVLNRGVLQIQDTTAQATGTGAGITLGGLYGVGVYTPGVQVKASKTNSTAGNYSFDMAFLTYSNGNANMTEGMRIDSSGNVGIGTTTPTSTAGFTPRLQLTSAASTALVLTKSTTAQQNIIGTDGAGLYIESAGNATAVSNAIIFRTADTNSSYAAAERMRITASGNVGIGSTGPVSKLEVVNTGIASLTVGYNNTSGNYYDADTQFFRAGNSSTEFMRLNSTGLGIGTSNPAYPLDVSKTVSDATSASIRIRNGATGGWGTNLYFNQYDYVNPNYYDALRIQTYFAGSGGTGAQFKLKNFSNSSEVVAMTLLGNGDVQINSGYGSVATAYGCRAWVNFNGTGTVAIRASGNVSSITDNGVGDYTINLTTAMPDVNYSVSGVTNRNTTGGYGQYICTPFNQAQTSSAFRIATIAYDGNFYDCPQVTLMVVR
jgi:hypothetical protein